MAHVKSPKVARFSGARPIRGQGVPLRLVVETETPEGELELVPVPVPARWSKRLAARLQAARAARKGGVS